MSPSDFLELTPQEINWKIDAYNEARRSHQMDVWNTAMLVAIGVNAPAKFPSFEKFCPDGSRRRAPSTFVKKAIEKARELGDI